MTTNDYPFLRRYLHKAVDNALAMNSIWQQDNKDLYREIQGHTPLSTGWDYNTTVAWLATHGVTIAEQNTGYIVIPTDYVGVSFERKERIKAMDDAILYALNFLQCEWYKKQGI
jgi:hypothetical protein